VNSDKGIAQYQTIVVVIKAKDGIPSVIQVFGKTYVLQHGSQYKGKKEK
jgi:hypothetical protein